MIAFLSVYHNMYVYLENRLSLTVYLYTGTKVLLQYERNTGVKGKYRFKSALILRKKRVIVCT